MHKKVFSSILVSLILFEQLQANTEQFDILAKNIVKRGNTVMAVGDVVVFSPTYYMTANKAIHNQATGDLQLFDDVTILKNNKEQFLSDTSVVNINTNDMTQSPAFNMDKETGMWMETNELIGKDKVYNLEETTVSSCDCEDPAWSIKFTDGQYDSQTKWFESYNTRLYIGDVPVLYTPYFGFSMDTRRRSGFLMPTFGYSSSEGFYYAQPYFYAPSLNWDLEIIPQYRTKRAWGLYTYLRWADSENSQLNIKTGFMKENGQYFDLYDLRNETHYGLDINYERYNFFTEKNDANEDGLYVDIHWMNDIEYKNLEEVDKVEDFEEKIESKINYYYKTPDYYGGVYFRYYLDASTDDNSQTLQQLPALQLHRFSEETFIDKLFYSADIQYTNLTRSTGIGADRFDILLPMSYTFNLFNDYVQLTLKEEINLSHLAYKGEGSSVFDDGTFIQAKHTITLSTDLIRSYLDFLHTVGFSATAVLPSQSNVKGDIYSINSTTTALSPFPVTEENKKITFAMDQSFYDTDSLKQIVNHKMKQSILYDTNGSSTLGNFENQLTYNYDYGSISNRLLYNHQDDAFIESSTNFSFNYDDYFLKLNHYYSKETPNSGKRDSRSYIFTVGSKFERFYNLSYSRYYDLLNDVISKQIVTLNVDKKCWAVNVSLEDSLVALASEDSDALRQKILFIQLFLKPLGGVKQQYKNEDKEDNDD